MNKPPQFVFPSVAYDNTPPPSITCPINVAALSSELASHLNKSLVHYLLHGFSHSFPIGYLGNPLIHYSPDLSSAHDHPEVITPYIKAECATGHTASPFTSPPFFPLNINPLGVVPKKQPDKWRLIMHLSHPHNHSVNDGIPIEEFSLHYITVDTAIDVSTLS